ncbi:MAG: efflux RND transporter periplasmic adaptor subunit [Anaerolineales bacterium]|nr:efflux RND transporter periplasmic adaptor subunit [Anaerolineales bacterium]
MKSVKPILILVAVTVFLAACGTASTGDGDNATAVPTVVADDRIVAEGRIEPIQYADMAFNSGGIVGEVLVTEGEPVDEDQVLACLENSAALEAEVARAEEAALMAEQDFTGAEGQALFDLAAAYETYRIAQQKMDDYDVPGKFDGMTPAEAVAEMKSKLDAAREAYEPYMGYKATDKYVRELEKRLDNAWADYNQAVIYMEIEADLNIARTTLETVRRDYDNLVTSQESGEKAIALARYEAALANLSAAKSALDNVELHAPFDGTVAGLDVRVGETVAAGQKVASMADFSDWIVKTTDLTELDVVEIKEGQDVIVTLDAIPNKPLAGKVKSIGQTYSERQGDVVYEVVVVLTETVPNMRWGMTAVVKFTK